MNKIEKVLLIWPPFERPYHDNWRRNLRGITGRFPLGIGYIAAYLERELNIETHLFDMIAESPIPNRINDIIRWGVNEESLKIRLRELQPQLVGISQMFSHQDEIVRGLFRTIKEVDEQIVTVWGGTHPTVMPDSCVRCPDVDYLILGEGEAPMSRLIQNINSGKNPLGSPSLAMVDAKENIIISTEREWIEDLDNHVLPARNKVEISNYDYSFRQMDNLVNMITSRGCPFACTFCSAPAFYQKRFKGVPPRRVADELEHLVDNYGVRNFVFQDENASADPKRMEALADEIIARNLDISWYCEAGLLISSLNPRLINKLVRSGMAQLYMPVESGDPAILHAMRKPYRHKHIKPIIEAARQAGIRVAAFLLLGIPGESVDQMRRTGEFAEELGFDWNHISLVMPVPG